ncbi:hypothetical protein DFH06DRAFT_1241970, partial [Mycena polygramma]
MSHAHTRSLSATSRRSHSFLPATSSLSLSRTLTHSEPHRCMCISLSDSSLIADSLVVFLGPFFLSLLVSRGACVHFIIFLLFFALAPLLGTLSLTYSPYFYYSNILRTIHLLLLPTSLPSPHALYSYFGMRLLSFFILLLITRRTRTHARPSLFFLDVDIRSGV